MKLSGHQNMRFAADGQLVEPGKGYQERIATRTADKEHRDYLNQLALVAQLLSRVLMTEREAWIEAGLIHETPAMEENHK
jgi:hypothetical protein